MHVRVRVFGKPDSIVVVESKLSKIDQFRRIIRDKFNVEPKLQRLLYGGKLLENGYTFHDYNIKLNDVIQLMVRQVPCAESTESKNEQKQKVHEDQKQETVQYKDAKSKFYMIGDLIDMKDKEQGAWFEGKIVRIVINPKANICHTSNNTSQSPEQNTSSDKESDIENEPPTEKNNEDTTKSKKKGIAKYFTKTSNNLKKKTSAESSSAKTIDQITDDDLLFKIQLDGDEEDSNTYCEFKEIRPRARNEIDVKDLQPEQTVMINYNPEDPSETGYWYDYKVSEINKLRIGYELIGTLYLGSDAVPQNDTKVKIRDKVFDIEKPKALAERTQQDKDRMVQPTDKRSMPLNCLTCRDDEDMLCKDCGCYLCSGKELPEKIVLCDECNHGYHMYCLTPALTSLPEEDWYCPNCKRDHKEVVAPGAAKQTKKSDNSKGKRDWGRGMACVGKTKTCAMPANHFGPIPGIEVGMCWRFRIQLSESGVHRPPVSGIHGRDVEGAYSIVLSGGYEDDVDRGEEFTYTGSGGRDLSGNKRTADQSHHQTLTRENKALARNCAVKTVSEEGGDAGDNWRQGKPVRVVRSYKMIKHFPKYAPKEGIRYDGIYKVVKYYPETGLSGFRVWKYLLRRDDPSPAPWIPGAKEYPIVYPDGYLEAEAQKKALKEKNAKSKTAKKKNGPKKRALKDEDTTDTDGESSPPTKKRKTRSIAKLASPSTSPNLKIPAMFSPKSKAKESKPAADKSLSDAEMEAIKFDELNEKLWGECITVCEARGKAQFVEYVTQVFLCIICQDVAVSPVTTPCLHNFCMACMKLAFKSSEGRQCPCCRRALADYEPRANERLKRALQTILPGYDAGKK